MLGDSPRNEQRTTRPILKPICCLALFLIVASGCWRIVDSEITPTVTNGLPQTGLASFYSAEFHGKITASGEAFDNTALTAAHASLPFDTRVHVRNRRNGKHVVVRINDRGPFVPGRIIDLSAAAAKKIGLTASHGVARVDLRVLT